MYAGSLNAIAVDRILTAKAYGTDKSPMGRGMVQKQA
jgi:hypothetical protein